jgi:hypothetical protein
MRAVTARRELEMPFEQGVAGAELGEDLVVCHGGRGISLIAGGPFAPRWRRFPEPVEKSP